MFRSANTSCMDVVLHFLYCRLQKPELAKKELKGLWPCKDVQQQKAFQKVLREFLLDLAQQKAIPRRLANAAQSLFKNAAGTRLTELLGLMSSLALQQHHARLFPADSARLNPLPLEEQLLGAPLGSQLEAVAGAQIAVQMKQLRSSIRAFASVQEDWDKAAAELSARYASARQCQQHFQPAELTAAKRQCKPHKEPSAMPASMHAGNPPSGYAAHAAIDNLSDWTCSRRTPSLPGHGPLPQQPRLKQLHDLTTSLQAHLASHAGLQSLAQQALLSRHHPCQIDGTALQQGQRSASTHVPSAEQRTATLQPSAPARGRTCTNDRPESTGHPGFRETGAGAICAELASAASSLHDKHHKRPISSGSRPQKSERKPLQELQPSQTLSKAAAHTTTGHADKPLVTSHLSGEPEHDNLHVSEQTTERTPKDSEPPLQPSKICSSPKQGPYASDAANDANNTMQQAGQAVAQLADAASPDKQIADSGGSIEANTASAQHLGEQLRAYDQQGVDLIELFKGANQQIQDLRKQLQHSAGVTPEGSLVSIAMPAAKGGREQAQLVLTLNQQRDRLAQLQAMHNSLQEELNAAGQMKAALQEQTGKIMKAHPGPLRSYIASSAAEHEAKLPTPAQSAVVPSKGTVSGRAGLALVPPTPAPEAAFRAALSAKAEPGPCRLDVQARPGQQAVLPSPQPSVRRGLPGPTAIKASIMRAADARQQQDCISHVPDLMHPLQPSVGVQTPGEGNEHAEQATIMSAKDSSSCIQPRRLSYSGSASSQPTALHIGTAAAHETGTSVSKSAIAQNAPVSVASLLQRMRRLQ
ncbi:hypothetical protein WJX74_006625 [Apatococcus lobatus]|uniref:HAUS augmin-like complex subunit 6 N-terminal domain-containing protein n=1 Tax=Apatococcus lobatus TaxID=904363 RepID=A0AAW1SF86_9CHLO